MAKNKPVPLTDFPQYRPRPIAPWWVRVKFWIQDRRR